MSRAARNRAPSGFCYGSELGDRCAFPRLTKIGNDIRSDPGRPDELFPFRPRGLSIACAISAYAYGGRLFASERALARDAMRDKANTLLNRRLEFAARIETTRHRPPPRRAGIHLAGARKRVKVPGSR